MVKEVHGLGYEFEIYTLRGPEKKDKWVTMLYEWFVKGSRLLRELDADVVLVNGVVPLAFKPKIAVARGPLVGITAIQRIVIKALYKMYDDVVCVSKASMREYEEIVKCDWIIPLPLKLGNFYSKPQSERENIVVHIGTRPVKNPWISIRAVEIIRERGYNENLVMTGSRSHYIEELCRGKNFVTLMFNVNEKEINKILCRAKALILPLGVEVFSYISLEAMTCATPLVISSSIPEDVVIHGYNGLRVDNINPIDHAEALRNVLKDENLWFNLSENAIRYVVKIAKRYTKLLRQFIQDREGKKRFL